MIPRRERKVCGTVRSSGVILAVLAAGMLAGGCGPILGGLLAKTVPPKKVPAEIKLQPAKILVLVEQVGGQPIYPRARQLLTEALNRQLLANHVAESVVSYQQLLRYRRRESRPYQLQPLATGAALGARYVIQVQVGTFEVSQPGNALFQPQCRLWVRLFDARQRRCIWPAAVDGKAVAMKLSIPQQRGEADGDADGDAQLARQLAELSAVRIGRFFYAHRPDKTLP